MNKKLIKACTFGFLLAPMFFMTSCTNQEKAETINVTYVDGETEVKKVEVEKGSKVENWSPSVDGKDFFGWYKEPTLTHEFDFTKAYDKDVTVFGAFVGYQKDERHWGIAGSGRSSLLSSSNWGKVFNDEHYLANESTSTKNVFTLTANLAENDEFQFTSPVIDGSSISWGHQRGAGYLEDATKEGVTYFTTSGGLGSDNSTSNIKVAKAGKYKFTLTTYPSGDFFVDDDTTALYKNRSYFDKIEFDYLGEFEEQVAQFETIFYMKGEKITGWGDYLNSYTKMTNDKGVAKLENVYLVATDQFMFASYDKNLSTNELAVGNTYIKATNLTDAAKELVDGSGNMSVKEDGYYTFTYDIEAKTLSVEKVTYTPKAGEYYIDGSFISWGGAGNDSHKMVNDTTDTNLWISENITLAVDDQLGIQFYDKATSSYNGFFSSSCLVKNDKFDTTATNIKCKVAGTYKVIYNSYSHLITIEEVSA